MNLVHSTIIFQDLGRVNIKYNLSEKGTPLNRCWFENTLTQMKVEKQIFFSLICSQEITICALNLDCN